MLPQPTSPSGFSAELQAELLLYPQNISFVSAQQFCSCRSLHSGLSIFCILSFYSSFEVQLKGHNVKLHNVCSDPSPASAPFPATSSLVPFPWHFIGVFIKPLTLSLTWVSHGHCLLTYGMYWHALPSYIWHVFRVEVCSFPGSLTTVPSRWRVLCSVRSCREKSK